MEALADERVHDEASFQAAVAARERRAEEQRREELGQGGSGPKRWAQEDGKEYPISTERAEAIAGWVREAPLGSKKAEDEPIGLEGGLEAMRVNEAEEAGEGRVEEEID
ncbi:MAG: hypothetical protein M1830_001449 [Pleopsidium flavum]|nr:MAG: hypothetical protein M1830_001449 [Pleopsidium flavum]